MIINIIADLIIHYQIVYVPPNDEYHAQIMSVLLNAEANATEVNINTIYLHDYCCNDYCSVNTIIVITYLSVAFMLVLKNNVRLHFYFSFLCNFLYFGLSCLLENALTS